MSEIALPQKKYAFGFEHRRRFRRWLSLNGFEVLPVTTRSEILKFRGPGGTGAVRKNARTKRLVWDSYAARVYRRFRANPQLPEPKPKRLYGVGDPLARQLRRRDGDLCFYCGDVVSEHDESVEHLVARTFGGPDHVSNLVLVHGACNVEAGTLSVREKVALREKMHAEDAA